MDKNQLLIVSKSFNFDTINYILNGQELVINSFQSNNITIEFDVYYNSYLYPNKYLDTIVLDMFIPDLTPPTILFKTEVIDISQSSLTNDISSIARLLINDISYIDINTDSNISFDNDISFSYKKIDETSMNYLNNNVDDSSYVNIYIDISQVANATINNLQYEVNAFTIGADCESIALEFTSDGKIEINDITIEYREKYKRAS